MARVRTYDILNAGELNRFSANGRIVSNSGRLLQLQNLPQNHINDLDLARFWVKEGEPRVLELFYGEGSTPEVLSQLIRTMLIPKPGYEFIVADYSAIEARVLSWEAGETWRLEAFKNGEDIYCASASQMFGKPVEKHGRNSELRQKGKVAELACIAADSLVLTDRGLVPIQYVTLNDKIWDGKEWCTHNGVIYKGEREIISYGGLSATPDHLVWVEGRAEPVEFAYAAASGAHLVQTGHDRQAIRFSADCQFGTQMEQTVDILLRLNTVPELRNVSMDSVLQSDLRGQLRVSEMRQIAESSSRMASQTINGSQAAVRQSSRPQLCRIRREGDYLRLSFHTGGGSVFNQDFWGAGSDNGAVPKGQHQELRSGEYGVYNPERKQSESENYGIIQVRPEILALLARHCNPQIIQGYDAGRDYSGGPSCGAQTQVQLENDPNTTGIYGAGIAGRCENSAVSTRKVKVYDILDCGPNHRFTVSNCLVHNCGYQGGTGALIAMGALRMGIPEDDLPELIQNWRDSNPKIVKYWTDMEKAAIQAVKNENEKAVNKIKFSFTKAQGKMDNILWMHLPSGRKLAYIKPQIGTNRFGKPALTFMGLGANNKWCVQETYGGKLTENCIGKGTKVVTDHGFIPIEQVQLNYKVWDGANWVHHEGLVYKGIQNTVVMGEVHLTPDHKVLIGNLWVPAEKVSGVIPARDPEPVYDLVNCGPYHRFTICDGTHFPIVSNCTQAIARDILAEAMLRFDQAGIEIVGSIHDEVILEVPKDKYTVDEICTMMCEHPKWCKDLPLNAAGYKGNYYYKD